MAEIRTLEEEMIPTLIIGLGGTGKMILTKLRAEFEQRFGDVPSRRIRLLELDIDPNLREGVAYYDDHEVLLKKEEFIDLGDVPAGAIIRDVQEGRHKPLQGWLSTDVRLMEANLRQGGQQIRQLGRLAFLWHAERIARSQNLRKRLEGIIAVVTSQYRADTTREARARLNIYIISSLCGGTGSGMFIDLAYLLRDILKGRGLLGNTTMSAFLTTSLFFSSAPQPNLRPNTWAALAELDYFTRASSEEKRYTQMPYFDDQWIEVIERPYDFTYLIDAIDHRGYNIEHPIYMTRLVSDILFLLTASPIGDEARSRINNVRAVRRTELGTVYSTSGVASLVTPVSEIRTIAAARLLQSFIPETLLVPPTGDEAELDLRRRLDSLVGEMGLSLEALHGRLTRDEQGRPLARAFRRDPRLSRGTILQISPEALSQEVPRRVELVRPEVDRDIEAHMEEEAKKAYQEFTERVEEEARRMAAERERGPLFAAEYLNRLGKVIDDLWTQADREQINVEARLESLKTSVAEAESAFRQKARRGGGLLQRFRGGGGAKAAETYLGAVQSELETAAAVKGYARVKRLLDQIKEFIRGQERGVRTFQERLEGLVGAEGELEREVKRAFDRISEMDIVRRRPIVARDEEIRPLYEPFMDGARRSLLESCFGEKGLIPELLEAADRAEVKGGLLRAAREALAILAQTSELHVETLIRKMAERGETTPAAVLEGLQNQAAYFWQTLTSETVARDQVEDTVTVIGVADKDHSLFSEQLEELARREGFTIISTRNPHAITILKMAHGFAYDTLAQRKTYVHDYRRAMDRLEPVQVFPEFNLNYKGNGRKRRQLLAKAWAYGIVCNQMEEFTFHPAEGQPEELLSDKGLFDALWRLVHEDELAARVEEAVKAFEKKNSKEDLLQLLDEFEPTERILREPWPKEEWLAQILKGEAENHRRNVERHR